MVTFIDSEFYIKSEEDDFLDKYFSFSWEEENLDAYFIGVFPIEHPKYFSHTIYFSEQWSRLFTQVKAKNSEISHKKGFIELIF